MADPLRSARTKLARADLHARTAKREAGRFVDKHPEPPLRVEPTTELENVEIGMVIELEIGFGDGPAFPDLPDSFAARFGDAIQNYRSALDHVAWQLVKHGKTPNPPDPHRVQFPIYPSQPKFKRELATRLPGVDRRPGGPCEFIEHCHGYKRGQARNATLTQLARLSNDDKHRTLHAMVTAVGSADHEIIFTDCRHTAFVNPPEPPRIEPGAVIARLTIVVTGDNPEVSVTPNLSAYVAMEGWSNAMDILTNTSREVAQIINAPQILRAL
jgi:hypothetical protein